MQIDPWRHGNLFVCMSGINPFLSSHVQNNECSSDKFSTHLLSFVAYKSVRNNRPTHIYPCGKELMEAKVVEVGLWLMCRVQCYIKDGYLAHWIMHLAHQKLSRKTDYMLTWMNIRDLGQGGWGKLAPFRPLLFNDDVTGPLLISHINQFIIKNATEVMTALIFSRINTIFILYN